MDVRRYTMTPEKDSARVTEEIQLLDDPFTNFVMARIPDDVRQSLSAEQYQAVRKAIFQSRPGQGHAVDLRFTVPLGIMRWYVVLQMGRDRRSKRRSDMRGKRSLTARVIDRVALLAILYCLTVTLLFTLYVIKSLLGINLFVDRHLLDIITG
jgi:hypothetical protein